MLLLIIPIGIVIIQAVREFKLRKIYNFNKEIKRVNSDNKPVKVLPEQAVALGKTPSGKNIYIPYDVKHIAIFGTTGSGKTVALANFIKSAINNSFPLVIVDGKGDIGAGSLLDITTRLKGNRKLYVINLTNPINSDKYNPFQSSSPTAIKDMIINMTTWSEEHYKLNTERYIQRVLNILCKFPQKLSFSTIIKFMNTNKFIEASMELLKNNIITKEYHQENIELAKTSGRIAESAIARFATIAESEVGQIFNKDGIDIYTALQENAIILFILNPMLYPEISPAFGRLILIDSKQAVNKSFGDTRRKFFLYDELSSYASTSLLDLVNKSRSANITCILATQSLSDLDVVGENFKEQVIENCNNYIILRQNSSVNAEHLANILGTRATMEVTYQLQQKGLSTTETGFGSAKRTREFLYHPDEIKVLPTGRGIYMSKDSNYHSKVIINKPF